MNGFSHSTRTILLCACLAVGLTGCGSDNSSDDETGGAPSGGTPADGGSGNATGSTGSGGGGAGEVPAAGCPRDARIGSFQVYLAEDRTIFSGTVADGVAPTAIPDVLAEEGSCQLLAPRDLFCSVPCASGESCAGDDTCVPTPSNVSVGQVTVSGLVEPLELEANGITVTYDRTITDPYPGFQAGATVSLSAAGDEVEAFSLNATGVQELATSASTVSVQEGSPTTLTWDASGADPTATGISISFSVHTHGGTTGWIECLVPDTGSFDVPASLVSQLIGMGLAGFPRATVSRISRDTATVSLGCVELSLSSDVTLDLEVEGLTSCDSADDCPTGQTCNEELLACE